MQVRVHARLCECLLVKQCQLKYVPVRSKGQDDRFTEKKAKKQKASLLL